MERRITILPGRSRRGWIGPLKEQGRKQKFITAPGPAVERYEASCFTFSSERRARAAAARNGNSQSSVRKVNTSPGRMSVQFHTIVPSWSPAWAEIRENP